jgi:hypothetical protein
MSWFLTKGVFSPGGTWLAGIKSGLKGSSGHNEESYFARLQKSSSMRLNYLNNMSIT